MSRAKATGAQALLARLEDEVRRMECGRIASAFLGGDERLAVQLQAVLVIPAGEPVPVYDAEGEGSGLGWEYEGEDRQRLPDPDAAHRALRPLLKRAFAALYKAAQAGGYAGERLAEAAQYAVAMDAAEAETHARPARVCRAEYDAMRRCGDALAAIAATAPKPQKEAELPVRQTDLCALVKRHGGTLSPDTVQRAERGENTRIPRDLRDGIKDARRSVQAADAWARAFAAWQTAKLRTRVAFNENLQANNGRR